MFLAHDTKLEASSPEFLYGYTVNFTIYFNTLYHYIFYLRVRFLLMYSYFIFVSLFRRLLLIIYFFRDLRCQRNTIHIHLLITYLFINLTWIITAALQTGSSLTANQVQKRTLCQTILTQNIFLMNLLHVKNTKTLFSQKA